MNHTIRLQSREKNDPSITLKEFKNTMNADISTVFSKRLNMLLDEENKKLKDKGLKVKSKKDFATDFEIAHKTLLSYLSGSNTIPDMYVVYTIADKLNVPIDYLLGRSDSKYFPCEKQAVADYVGLSDESVEILNLLKGSKISSINETLDLLVRSLEPTASLKVVKENSTFGYQGVKVGKKYLEELAKTLSTQNNMEIIADDDSLVYMMDYSSDSVLMHIDKYLHVSENPASEVDMINMDGKVCKYKIVDLQQPLKFDMLTHVKQTYGCGSLKEQLQNLFLLMIFKDLIKMSKDK